MTNHPTHSLTDQERQARADKIVRLLEQGLTRRTVAYRIGVSETVVGKVARAARAAEAVEAPQARRMATR